MPDTGFSLNKLLLTKCLHLEFSVPALVAGGSKGTPSDFVLDLLRLAILTILALLESSKNCELNNGLRLFLTHYECLQVLGLCLAGQFISVLKLPAFGNSVLYLIFRALFCPTTNTELVSRIGIDFAYLKLKKRRWWTSLSQ